MCAGGGGEEEGGFCRSLLLMPLFLRFKDIFI